LKESSASLDIKLVADPGEDDQLKELVDQWVNTSGTNSSDAQIAVEEKFDERNCLANKMPSRFPQN